LEEIKVRMIRKFEKPLTHRDIADIWENLQKHPDILCGEGKSPITLREVWESLSAANDQADLDEALRCAKIKHQQGGYEADQPATPPIKIPSKYHGHYVGITMMQQMYPDKSEFY
jgi:hypothetical protein